MNAPTIIRIIEYWKSGISWQIRWSLVADGTLQYPYGTGWLA